MSNNLKINKGIDINNSNNAYYYPGDIIMVNSTDSVPEGWLDCNGQVYDENLYKDLKDVLGTYFGGGSAYKIPNLNASLLNDAAQNFPLYPSSITSTTQNYYQNPGDNTYHFHIENFSNNSDLYESEVHSHSASQVLYDSNFATMNHTHAISTTPVAVSATTNPHSGSLSNRANTGTGALQVPSGTHTHSITEVKAFSNSSAPSSHRHTVSVNYNISNVTNHTHIINNLITSQNEKHYPLSKSMRFIIKV
jgi:microcystin-dependent protein